jgi:hypothetical protein
MGERKTVGRRQMCHGCAVAFRSAKVARRGVRFQLAKSEFASWKRTPRINSQTLRESSVSLAAKDHHL